MRRRWMLFVVVFVAVSGSCWWGLGRLRQHQREVACKQREAAFNARAYKIRKGAHDALRFGTPKQDVFRFFAEQDMPIEFYQEISSGQYVARGEITTSGCAPVGCDTDAAIIVVSLRIGAAGTALEEPNVFATYTGCP